MVRQICDAVSSAETKGYRRPNLYVTNQDASKDEAEYMRLTMYLAEAEAEAEVLVLPRGTQACLVLQQKFVELWSLDHGRCRRIPW
jgi:triphosphoribosyl-dephospho-CoA synthetase